MLLFRIAAKSLLNRRTSVLLTIISIAVSVALLLGVEKIRDQAKQSFTNTISGTDLIIGARSGSVQLLLYSVFRIGDASNNITWQSYQDIAGHSRVAWTIPISLGDSHRGYRVVGTNTDYFKHYKYGRKQPLVFSAGNEFNKLHDVVLGAEVAKQLNYRLGDELVVAHGTGNASFAKHEDQPFHVSGILEPTGTPVDRALYVSLEAIEAIHVDWKSGAYLPGSGGDKKLVAEELQPEAITAILVGLKSKVSTFQLQRAVNNYRKEPLLAILPGVALQQLWGMLSVAENAMLVISACVVLSGLFGMLTVLLSGLNERRREMAILRSVGARPAHIYCLLVMETCLLTLLGILLGTGLLFMVLAAGLNLLETEFGLYLQLTWLSLHELGLLGAIFVAGLCTGLIPGYRAYRYSLADGMTIRI